jgi:hypothetical protein
MDRQAAKQVPKFSGKRKKKKDKSKRSSEPEQVHVAGTPRDMLLEGPAAPEGPVYIRGYYDKGGVWVVWLDGDFETFVDKNGETLAFRRKGTYRELAGAYVPGSWGAQGKGKSLSAADFRTALTSHLALAVRRAVVREDVIARSSQLMSIINKAMSELEDLRDANMRQSRLREEIETVRMRMFTRLMAADLRKGPPLKR